MIQPPFDGYGPGLVAEVWKQLQSGQSAAEALRRAKEELLKAVVASGDTADLPYVYKTVLQYQCYGHADARL